MSAKPLKYYSRPEENLNIATHGLGVLLSIVALVLLIDKAHAADAPWYLVSFTVFGVSLILLYTASTLYHASVRPELRSKFKVLDHAVIFVLIAGTYTPFTLITLHGWIGWTIFGVVWGIAAVGMVFKLFHTGRYEKISTIAYVAMGWIIVFAIVPLIQNLATGGLWWLLAGGACYTIGAVLYRMHKLPYNHAIFHVFVLLGSFSHFMAVYKFV